MGGVCRGGAEAVPRRDPRSLEKMGRLQRRDRGGPEAGSAFIRKNGAFAEVGPRRSRGGTEAVPRRDPRSLEKIDIFVKRDRPPRLAFKNLKGYRGGATQGVFKGLEARTLQINIVVRALAQTGEWHGRPLAGSGSGPPASSHEWQMYTTNPDLSE